MDYIRLLQSVGLKTFVNHFYDFKNRTADECRKILLAEGYSLNSARVKTSKAQQIINQDLVVEVLHYIIDSSIYNSKDKTVVEEAKRILNDELLFRK